MEISWKWLRFTVEEGKITLRGAPFAEVQVAGRNEDNHLGAKQVCLSETPHLRYVSHTLSEETLAVVQADELVQVTVYLHSYVGSAVIRARTEVKNISEEPLTVTSLSSFVLPRICSAGETERTHLWRFLQSHHGECQPRRQSLSALGLYPVTFAGQQRIAMANIGSWSTKEALPQGIVEGADGCIMFQIESNNSWYYEISDTGGQYYLYLGGANEPFGDWCKPLRPGESYTSVPVALCTAGNAESAIREMTKYRRRIAGRCAADEGLPVIFNEYMHLSWDSPSEENTRRCALAAAEAGAEYYVIDCGWHDEVPGSEVYPYVGVWKESKARFPSGLRKTTDYIRSLGMKPGLWIEPEVVGYKCGEMLAYYGEDCFFRRHGKKVCVQGRYFLDFRAEKVRAYLTETVRRMIEEYGAEYIKTDYNQDAGVGTERDAASFGEGLELCAKAYLGWVDEMRARFPQVLFETCASGGLRMDHETLQHFSIVSTSDQTDYKKYPYIAGNILSAALPEQAAVWSYPVGSDTAPNGVFAPTRAWVEENITEEQVVMNMVNALLGRMHLASRIGLLTAEKFALVQEGVAYYKTLSKAKKEALPVFPLGFTSFGEKQVAAGFEAQGKVYLAVWNLGGGNTLRLPLRAPVTEVRVAYPQAGPVRVRAAGTALEVAFTKPFQACFLEAEGAETASN